MRPERRCLAGAAGATGRDLCHALLIHLGRSQAPIQTAGGAGWPERTHPGAGIYEGNGVPPMGFRRLGARLTAPEWNGILPIAMRFPISGRTRAATFAAAAAVLGLAAPAAAETTRSGDVAGLVAEGDCTATFCRPRQASGWHGAAFGATILAVVGLARRPRPDA